MSKSKNRRRRQTQSGRVGAQPLHRSPGSTKSSELTGVTDPDTPAPGPDTHGPGPGEQENDEAAQIQFLVGLIATGALDDHLGTLQVAIAQRHHDRQRAASHQAAARLQIGDRVLLNHEIRPLYLHGATGTVTGWAQQNAIVQLDTPTGRFTTGQIRCPPLGLQRLPE